PVVVEALGERRRRNLQVVTEHPVVAHFQVLDAGPLSLAPLEVEEPAAAVGGMGTEVIQLGYPAPADHTLAEGQRRVLLDGRPNLVRELSGWGNGGHGRAQ